MSLRDVSITEKSVSDGLHIEAPGCAVDIKHKLFDAIHDRKIVRVDIRADQFSGEEWNFPDFGGRNSIGIRVAEGKYIEPAFKFEKDDKEIGPRKRIVFKYREKDWVIMFEQKGAFGYTALCVNPGGVMLHLGDFIISSTSGNGWPKTYEYFIEAAQNAIKAMYKLVEG